MTNDLAFTYLSMILKDPKRDDAELAEVLAEATGKSTIDLLRNLRRVLPAILGELSLPATPGALAAVKSMGGEACAPSLVDLQVHGEAILTKHLTPGSDYFGVEPWRGEAFVVKPSDLRSIVFGVIMEGNQVRQQMTGGEVSTLGNLGLQATIGGPVPVVPSGNLGQSISAGNKNAKAKSSRVVIDLHFTGSSPRRIVRIDGNKQGWSFLGESREHTDIANATKAMVMFRSLAPHATPDECFTQFNCPVSSRRLKVPGVPPEIRGFDFYSRWIGHIHRVLRGESPNS
jgi:hypothetical protein